jgi:hypothetical protein
MSAASNELESRLGHYVLRSGLPIKPAALWLGLYRSDDIPDETEGGHEVSSHFFGQSTGYQRVLCGPGDSWWVESTTTPGQFYNAQMIQFPQALYNWGTVTGWALHADSVSGAYWISGRLATNLVVNSGDPPAAFLAGSLVINFF